MPRTPSRGAFLARFLALPAALTAGGCLVLPPDPLDYEEEVPLDAVPLVYGGSRAVRTTLDLPPDQWEVVVQRFEPPAETPRAERAQISEAVGLMERIASWQAPIGRDQPGTFKDYNGDGWMNCVDESTNTSVFLKLFRQQGLMRYHEPEPRLGRAKYKIMVHFSAQIREVETGERFAVDSNFGHNGEPAIVQRREPWLAFEPLPDEVE